MTKPHNTVQYVMDDMSQRIRNAWMDQGGGAYIHLIDINGKLAYSDCLQNVNKIKGVSFYDEFIYIRMNDLDSALKHLSAQNWIWKKDSQAPLTKWRRSPLLKAVKVKSIDENAGLLTVSYQKDKKPVELTVRIATDTRIMNSYTPANFKSIKPGQHIRLSYTMTDPPNVSIAISIELATTWPMDQSNMWVSAKTIKIDKTKGIIHLQRDTPAIDKMIGYQFWKQAGPKAFFHDKFAKAKFDVVDRWASMKEQNVYQLKMDRAVIVWIDGVASSWTDIKPGDQIGFQLYCFDEHKPLIYPLRVRAYRGMK